MDSAAPSNNEIELTPIEQLEIRQLERMRLAALAEVNRIEALQLEAAGRCAPDQAPTELEQLDGRLLEAMRGGAVLESSRVELLQIQAAVRMAAGRGMSEEEINRYQVDTSKLLLRRVR